MTKPVAVSELRHWLPARKPDSHKGDFGHVLIVAGSRGMSGAAVLAAKAALRSGAGLVTLAVPLSLQSLVAGMLPEALTFGQPPYSELRWREWRPALKCRGTQEVGDIRAATSK